MMAYQAWKGLEQIQSVEAFYRRAVPKSGVLVHSHLPRLRALAHGLALCVDCGVRRGASSAAMLLGAAKVIGIDVFMTAEARRLQVLAGRRWRYLLHDSRTVTIPECDLLFLDSRHTAAQVSAELSAHAGRVRRFIAFHDTTRYGTKGEDGGPGIWTAIRAWLARDAAWTIRAEYPGGSGFLITERIA